MKVLLLLALAVAAVSAVKVTKFSSRAQIAGPDQPMVLDNSAVSANARSEVNVVCGRDTVTVTITNAAAADAQASIVLGSPAGDPACRTSGLQAMSSSPSVASTAAVDCGRVGNAASWVWTVRVVEQYPKANPNLADEFSSGFEVECRKNAEQPPEEPEFQPEPPKPEGPAIFNGGIPFQLVVSAASTAREWILELRPEDVADLAALSYTIEDLTASSTGAAGDKTAALIENGCSVVGADVEIDPATNPDQLTSIRVKAFQFTGNPGVPVSFTATVRLCDDPEASGACPARTCPAPRTGVQQLRRVIQKRSAPVLFPQTFRVQVAL